MRHADEIARRLAEIRADPILLRRLDVLRRGEVSRVPMDARFASMRRDRVEEIYRERTGAR